MSRGQISAAVYETRCLRPAEAEALASKFKCTASLKLSYDVPVGRPARAGPLGTESSIPRYRHRFLVPSSGYEFLTSDVIDLSQVRLLVTVTVAAVGDVE